MALKVLARIALRPHYMMRLAAAALALAAVAGCSHRRDSMRPIYGSPAAVSVPAPAGCTNCGSGSRSGVIVNSPASGASASSSSRILSSDPSLGEPSNGTESSVPPLDESASTSRSSGRSALPEPAPKASIGDEPELDAVPSRSQSLKPRNSASPSSSSSPTGRGPALQGPAAATSSTSWRTNDGIQTASATGRVQRTSTRDRLRPFLGDSGENELFYPNKADRPWQYIVLHHSANAEGNYDRIDGEHRKVLGYDGCGYHFVIGNGTGSDDGQIEVAQRWAKQKHGVHCRNAKRSEIDEYGIGICLVGDMDKDPPTARQISATRALITYLSGRYQIDAGRVDTHAHLAATPTVCPGRQLSLDVFLSPSPREASTTDSLVPTSWGVARTPGGRAY